MTRFIAQHEHVESADPRRKGFCACGAPMPAVTVQPAPMMRRDLGMERDLFRQAASGVADPDRLAELCAVRAASCSGEYVPDPMLVLTDVDDVREIREEIADACNRTVWWMQKMIADRDDSAQPFRLALLAKLLEADQILAVIESSV